MASELVAFMIGINAGLNAAFGQVSAATLASLGRGAGLKIPKSAEKEIATLLTTWGVGGSGLVMAAARDVRQLVPFEHGGVVNSPTVALLGEAGPELILPLGEVLPTKRTRKKTATDRIMKRALREANAKARKKNGDWKKGWNQSRVMKEAHRLRRKYGPSTKKGQVRKTARRAYTR